jgi:hypothetical protein
MEINPVAPVISSAKAPRSDEQHQQRPSTPAPPPAPSAADSRFEVVAEDGTDIVYRAVDPETGAVLAQVPSEEVMRVAKRLEEMIAEGTIK